MANHVHWIYWAYKSRDGDNLREVVAIDVMADSEADALKKAKGLYKLTGRESGYMLKNVIEHLGESCGH